MKERIEHICKEFRLSSAQFADSIGVQRSSISHILSGRNKPSYDFIHKILLKYPNINANWLITGQGDMLILKSPNTPEKTIEKSSTLSTEPANSNDLPLKPKIKPNLLESKPSSENNIEEKSENIKITNVNSVKNIILMYDDDTFKILNSR